MRIIRLSRLIPVAALALLLCTGTSSCLGANPEELDWSTWQRIPVLHGGRLKPLDTFARQTVDSICGRERPKLGLSGATADDQLDSPALAQARKLFPDGASRRFSAAELLFSWLVEPEKWDRVPFLPAVHEKVRKDLFDLPLRDKQGERLKYVSPWQVAHSSKFAERIDKLAQMQSEMNAQGKSFDPVGVDKKVMQLYQAYMAYGALTFNPREPGTDNRRLTSRLQETFRAWSGLEPSMNMMSRFGGQDGLNRLIGDTSADAKKLMDAFQGHGAQQEIPSLEKLEPLMVKLSQSSAALAEQFRSHSKRLLDSPPQGIEGDRLEQMRIHMRTITARSDELARQSKQAILALYDNGQGLRLVPGLDPTALEQNRDERDDAQPWLGLQTLLMGSPAVLADYPAGPLQGVREAFGQVASIYVNRDARDRPAEFAAAMDRLAAALRTLGEAVEPLRDKLPIQHRDDALMAATAYPPAGSTDVELLYNRTDPFLWSWTMSLAAMVCFGFGLVFGVGRKPLFWVGIVILLAALAATLAGLGLRWHITGLVPVTNMFETVVFSALVVAAMGAWFTLLPLIWPGLLAAWQMTGLPRLRKTATSGDEAAGEGPGVRGSCSTDGQNHRTANWLLILLRVLLSYGIFYALSLVPYGASGEPIFSLLPKTDVGSSLPTLSNLLAWIAGLTVNSVLTWSVGLCVLAVSVWYVPRLLLATLLSVATIPYSWKPGDRRKMIDHVLAREAFVLVGAAVAFFAGALAYFAPAPVFIREIGPVRPILRDNFWLLIHVLTITASYGAGALAWGLGNIALAYYLFGKYREPAAPSPEIVAEGHRPAAGYTAPAEALTHRAPEQCAMLAAFIYKATQAAVLLLVAGTILGALWADVAWGRFWGWDSKEVAALITTLVYLVILHGRYAGWFGNFGLAVGSVLGATAIISAWYGVNYLFGSGLHSYGTGAGGKLEVGLVVAADWIFMAVAAARYFHETRK